MSLSTKQWRDLYDQACLCYEALQALAQLPIEDEVDASNLLNQWQALMHELDFRNLDKAIDPGFTEPFFDQLQTMNEELKRSYQQRRDLIATQLNKQQKTTASIKAYQNT